MKTAITLLLCMISILSFGQVKLHNENEGLLNQCDSSFGYPILKYPLLLDKTKVSACIDSGRIDTASLFYTKKQDRKLLIGATYSPATQDTIPVIMQVSDTNTTTYPRVYYTGNGSLQGIVYWIKGYEVFEKHNSVEGQAIYNTKDYYEYKIFKEYLDENRKPLSKNIIVWQSK